MLSVETAPKYCVYCHFVSSLSLFLKIVSRFLFGIYFILFINFNGRETQHIESSQVGIRVRARVHVCVPAHVIFNLDTLFG